MLRRRATLKAWQRTTSPTGCSLARSRLDDLRGAVEARAPWPASENFGAEPESSWYPPELLAHVAEMVPYWMAQIERILEGYPEPVPFGRVQTDEERIAAIGRDRALPVGELFDRIADADRSLRPGGSASFRPSRSSAAAPIRRAAR